LNTIRAWPLAQGAREEEAWLAAYDQSVGRGAFLRLDLELDGAGRIRPDDAALLERIGIAVGDQHEAGCEWAEPLAVLVLGTETHDGRRPPVEVVFTDDDLGFTFTW